MNNQLKQSITKALTDSLGQDFNHNYSNSYQLVEAIQNIDGLLNFGIDYNYNPVDDTAVITAGVHLNKKNMPVYAIFNWDVLSVSITIDEIVAELVAITAEAEKVINIYK